ncbi:unnamed protein product [Pleuronectes platessa]|uniref:Uncharacterized protein n=1 Tax=Pleuronectes platessa TaxID=8262 RepID=A0A9N7VA95_PLEPL|nr:unnamed protein product [Pleuronectes platessa]
MYGAGSGCSSSSSSSSSISQGRTELAIHSHAHGTRSLTQSVTQAHSQEHAGTHRALALSSGALTLSSGGLNEADAAELKRTGGFSFRLIGDLVDYVNVARPERLSDMDFYFARCRSSERTMTGVN